MSSGVPPALSHDALFAKSIVYIRRAFRARGDSELEEYQLWASLSLELLGKAALASIHPCLIADPQHAPSMFAAAGQPYSADTKTIMAKTLFERLSHANPSFDPGYKVFADQMCLRRNAELHSGDAPFMATKAAAWEVQYWGAVNVLLQMLNESFDSWLGSEKGNEQAAFVKEAEEALMWEITNRIQRSREQFEEQNKNPAKRNEQVSASHSVPVDDLEDLIRTPFDELEGVDCPSCGGLGVAAGVIRSEEVSSDGDDDGPWAELVRSTYSIEEFGCPVCGLHLSNRREIVAAQMPTTFQREEVRELEYEPDYGNE